MGEKERNTPVFKHHINNIHMLGCLIIITAISVLAKVFFFIRHKGGPLSSSIFLPWPCDGGHQLLGYLQSWDNSLQSLKTHINRSYINATLSISPSITNCLPVNARLNILLNILFYFHSINGVRFRTRWELMPALYWLADMEIIIKFIAWDLTHITDPCLFVITQVNPACKYLKWCIVVLMCGL